MIPLRPAARALASGGLAGLLALAIDQLLAVLTLGFPVPIAPRHALAYAGLGALGALALMAGARLLQRPMPGGWALFSVAAAGVYAPAIFERVHHALGHRTGPALAIVAATLAVSGYGLWSATLVRIAKASARSLAPLLGALGAAAGLAINRNLVDYPLEPAALFADVAVLGATLALAYLGRAAGARRVLTVLAALGAGAAAVIALGWRTTTPPAAETPAEGRRPPNLVLVVIDTLRQDVFRQVVHETVEGQAFRRAIDGAAWFDHAIAASPWTVPSVGSIMTGLYPQEHGFGTTPVEDPSRPLKPLAESVTTLAEHLHRRGYRTEAIGTNPLLQPVTGIARGFESYEILSGPTLKLPPLTPLVKLGLLPSDYYQQASSMRRRLRRRLPRMTAGDQPVFLWLHLMDPHEPLMSHRGLAPDPAAAGLDELESLYRNEVRFALRELTSILELFHAHGLWDNTALVAVSDHGEMFPSDDHDTGVKIHGSDRPKLYGHGHAMYGELVRVPLVIRPPGGLGEDRQMEQLASHVDLLDTIADLLKLDLQRTGDERVSLAPWLASEPPDPSLPARSHALVGANQHGPRQRALRGARVKLIDYPDHRRRPSELYFLDSDPGERNDVAGSLSERLTEAQFTLEHRWASLGEAPETQPVELDAETLERLKALGYLP